jgi:hypothetical protein
MNQVWTDLLHEHGIDCVILDPVADRAQVEALGYQAGWSVRFAHPDVVLFCRVGMHGVRAAGVARHRAVGQVCPAGVEDDTCSAQSFGVKGRG